MNYGGDIISSKQNPRIRQVRLLLEKSRERRKSGHAVVEGLNEIRLCLKAGFRPVECYWCPERISESALDDVLKSSGAAVQRIAVTPEVFSQIAYRDGVENAVLVFETRESHFEEFTPSADALLVVLERVEKPGNLGAILRSADAMKADAVLVCDASTDIWNPNVIRSSVGCVFTVPVLVSSNEEAMHWLKKNKIRSYAACPEDSSDCSQTDLRGPVALVMGTEADGLSDYWEKGAGHRIKIPMLGMVDSLNVSTATAMLLYEARRQKGFSS